MFLNAQNVVLHLFHLHFCIREQQGRIYLELVALRIYGRVGIMNIIFTHHNGGGVGSADSQTCCYAGARRETVGSCGGIPDGGLTEVRTFVEREDAMFCHSVNSGEVDLYGKAQRTFVQDFIRIVAPRIDNLSVPHETRCATTQCGAYSIAVEGTPVVEMERQSGVVAV